MFLNTRRQNPFFDDMDRVFDNFFDHDDFFSSFGNHDDFFLTKEEQLKRTLNQLHTYENKVTHQIKTYENSIDQLKKQREQIEKKKTEISEKIAKLAEERKIEQETQKKLQNSSTTNSTSSDSSKVFKRVHYKTPDMEIEEQYDSHNPSNCYKIVRKQGEAPQVLTGAQAQCLTHETQKLEPLGEGLDTKFESLCRLAGKSTPELRSLVLDNKELSVGQLYDKAESTKLL